MCVIVYVLALEQANKQASELVRERERERERERGGVGGGGVADTGRKSNTHRDK